MTAPRRLGRGLGGLLQSTVPEPTPEEAKASDSIALEEVRPNPYQPRRRFDEAALAELQASIAAHGLLQPIVVRRAAGGFEIVAGERRVRACRALGQPRIAAVVREVDDGAMQTLALVENLQREDLGPIEKAKALQTLLRDQGLTQEAVAARIGKDRVTVANWIRLLELPEEVQARVEDGTLTAGHARALLQVSGDAKRRQLAEWVVDRGLSVRDVERYARLTPGARPKKAKDRDPFLADLENRLRRALSLQVRLTTRGKGGTLEIDYHDATELDSLLERLGAS